MSKLTPLKNTELSEYCIGILAKHDIQLVVEFIKEKPEKLMKILNLNDVQIQKIKAELKRMYGPIKTNWSEKFQIMNESENPVEVKGNGQYYSTLIGPLDDLLAPSVITQTFSNNERCHMLGRSHLTTKIMWEICGPSGVGKTQLALTLVCNFIQLRQAEVLYIDTKLDFSTARLKQILTSRQLKTDIVAGIMQNIKVERVLSAQGVVEMLDSLYAELRNGSTFVRQIKMIVIDSLPAVWFLLKAEINRLAGKWLLSRLSQIIYRLCDEFSIAVICVNLSLIPSQSDIEEKHHQPFQTAVSLNSRYDHDISDILENDDDDDLVDVAAIETKNLNYRQVMGHFWVSKPCLRLSMEYISDDGKELRRSSRRILKVVQSTCIRRKTGCSCTVRICDQGVV